MQLHVLMTTTDMQKFEECRSYFEKCGYKFYNCEKKELIISALYSLDVEELLLQELEIKHKEEVGSETFINDCKELFSNEKIIIEKSMMETIVSNEIEYLCQTSVAFNETNEDSNSLIQTLFFGHNFDSSSMYIK